MARVLSAAVRVMESRAAFEAEYALTSSSTKSGFTLQAIAPRPRSTIGGITACIGTLLEAPVSLAA